MQVPRIRFTAQALHQAGKARVVAEFLVPVGADEKHRSTRNLSGKKMQESQAGVICPLKVVDHED